MPPTAKELYERGFGGEPPRCPWEKLAPEYQANWERIACERPARIAASIAASRAH